MSSHRRPTMPESFRHPVKGHCRWCSLPVFGPKGEPVNRARCWHPECVTIYRIACFSDDQRRAVFKRDKGICARCGCNAEVVQQEQWKLYYAGTHAAPRYAAWEADHIRPLIEANGRIEYFLLDNLQTLCHACHVAKGKEDNRRRKAERDAEYQRRLLTVQPELL